MARLCFFGTCSGTEPMEGMHQCSMAIECGGEYYWLDAGEGCAHTAYLMGVDPLKTRAVFLSHMHFDHTGGLSHLLFCIQKMLWHKRGWVSHENTIDILAPDLDVVRAIKDVAFYEGPGNYDIAPRFQIRETLIRDGLIYSDEHLCVTAHHSPELGDGTPDGWRSFCFLVEVRRVYFFCFPKERISYDKTRFCT